MSIYKIRQVGAPVLQQKAFKVAEFDKSLRKLAKHLWDTMKANNGIGLAAPQIGRGVCVAVVSAGGFHAELVNPVILNHNYGEEPDREGCLSATGVRRVITRSRHITVTWMNLQGISHTTELDGLASRCVQHEVDHLLGRLITDHDR